MYPLFSIVGDENTAWESARRTPCAVGGDVAQGDFVRFGVCTVWLAYGIAPHSSTHVGGSTNTISNQSLQYQEVHNAGRKSALCSRFRQRYFCISAAGWIEKIRSRSLLASRGYALAQRPCETALWHPQQRTYISARKMKKPVDIYLDECRNFTMKPRANF